jgi:hypothetical protein
MKNGTIYCVVFGMALTLACSKSDNPSNATPAAPEPSSGTPVAAPAAADAPSNNNSVRGRLVSVSDTVLTVSSRGGDVRVQIAQPLEVYSRVPAKFSDVKQNSFVGITSAPQPDGSLRALEIHIFPEKLRGTNEGSFLMGQRGGQGSNGSTMTNGAVSGPRMTNGTVANSGNRMTNGTVGTQSGSALTVRFQSDSQTIVIPPNVAVTAIAITPTKLAPGMNVTIPTTREADGTLKASRVMLSAPRRTG